MSDASTEPPGPFADSIMVPGERLTLAETVQHAEVSFTHDSPVRLESIKDEHRGAIQRYGRMLQGLSATPICPGDDRTDDFLRGPLWHTYRPRRSAFHHPRPGLVWAIKGNGERGWRCRAVLLRDESASMHRRAPITVNESPLLPSFGYFGGLPVQVGARELVVGLMLRAICRKEGITPSLVEPLVLARPAALPWDDQGSMSVHGPRDHHGTLRYRGALPLGMTTVRELAEEDFGRVCVLHQVGSALHARIPEYRLLEPSEVHPPEASDLGGGADEAPAPPEGPSDHHTSASMQAVGSGPRQASTRGMYAGADLDEAMRRQMVRSVAVAVGTMLKVAHANGVCFSLDPNEIRKVTGHPLLSTQFSSLHPSNISMDGEVCDLETVRAEPLGDRLTQAMFQQDIDNAYDSIRLWGAALDLRPRLGLARAGTQQLEQASGLPPPWA